MVLSIANFCVSLVMQSTGYSHRNQKQKLILDLSARLPSSTRWLSNPTINLRHPRRPASYCTLVSQLLPLVEIEDSADSFLWSSSSTSQ